MIAKALQTKGDHLLDPGQVWLCPAVDRFAPVNSNEPTLGERLRDQVKYAG
jgi:hypothetical protein